MVIEFLINHGKIRIDAEEFFREAGIRQIRRMLKMLSQDRRAAEEYPPKIREYLRQQEQAEHDLAVKLSGDYIDIKTQLVEAESKYKEMQSPCYACFTRDKDVLEAARQVVQSARSECQIIKRQIGKSRKLEQWYKDIQGDVNKIFGG